MGRKKKEENVTINQEQELIKGVTYDPEPLESDVDESELKNLEDSFYDPEKTQVDLEGLASISKDVKKSMANVSDDQIRIIIDSYYQTQKNRIGLENQIRAVKQGFDQTINDKNLAIDWLAADYRNRENQIKKMIDEYVKSNPVCKWASSIMGIGPIFAANLYSYIDMDICKHANQFLNYAGLNDNNIPWLGREKGAAIVNEAYTKFGLKASDKITDDVLMYVAEKSGRKFETVLRGFNSHKAKLNSQKEGDIAKDKSDKAILSAYLAKPPYNTDLKTMCYLIGHSFVIVSKNEKSLYGRIYRERKAFETMQNEKLAYKDQAARILTEKNLNKNTPTYKCLIEGKLSPAHINQRAQRYATKIFLTHFFEACWIDKYHTAPPVIYPIAFQDHVDYIEPEVPYSDFIN